MNAQLLVIAKAPVPGRVKTRLCPPCTPEQAAHIAAAALSDTLDAVTETPAVRRVLVLDGQHPAPAGWNVVAQRGEGLGQRLVNGYADTALPGVASLLVGMDTPQLTPVLLTGMARRLVDADAVLGPAEDGGWWALALRDPYHAEALRDVRMSTSDTAQWTVDALRGRGLRVRYGPVLRDVDTAADALAVAAACPSGAFRRAVHANLAPVSVR
jgi:rSAM/selenodomain-associated transferase 1